MARRHDRASKFPAGASEAAAAARRSGESGVVPADRTELDVLSDVLQTIRLTAALFFPFEASSPWADAIPDSSALATSLPPRPQHVVSYHILLAGQCWLALPDEHPVRLDAGDIVVIPHGDAYVMSSAPGRRPDLSEETVLAFFRQQASGSAAGMVVEGGGGPERARMACGFLGCDVRPFNPVLEALPRLIHLRRRATSASGRLAPLVELAIAESCQPRAGTRTLLLRLSEVLFIEVIRRYLDSLPADRHGWLSGLRDPTVGRALALLHDRPADAWTLERLAHDVGISRSTLADRFARLVGEPPMRYLARWRLQLASRRLLDGAAKVSAVALDVGYRSEAAFSRAFKDATGFSPAAWRAGGREA